MFTKKYYALNVFLMLCATIFFSPLYSTANIPLDIIASKKLKKVELKLDHLVNIVHSSENALAADDLITLDLYKNENVYSFDIRSERMDNLKITIKPKNKENELTPFDLLSIKVNGNEISHNQIISDNNPFAFITILKNKTHFELTAKRHQFQFADLKQIYHFNPCFFFSVLVISFLIINQLMKFALRYKTSKPFYEILFATLFFIILFLPIMKINLAEDSPREKRRLALFPTLFNSQGELNSRIGPQFNEWLSDRFFGRAGMLKIHSFIFTQGNSTVLKGMDDFLFYKKDNSIRNFQNRDLLNQEELDKITTYMSDLKTWCEKNNIDFYYMIVPDKNKIYGEKINTVKKLNPDSASRSNQLISHLKSKIGLTPIYFYDLFHKKKSENLLYFKNDTHWTPMGAFYAYEDLINLLNKKGHHLKKLPLTKTKTIKYPKGDLISMGGLPDDNKTEYVIPNYENTGKCVQKTDFHLYCKNPVQGKRLVIMRDSFVENLKPFLNASFSEVTYLKQYQPEKSDLEYIKKNADILILEQGERGLPMAADFEFPKD